MPALTMSLQELAVSTNNVSWCGRGFEHAWHGFLLNENLTICDGALRFLPTELPKGVRVNGFSRVPSPVSRGDALHVRPHQEVNNPNKERDLLMDIKKFVRKPFFVDGVQVTEENLDEVGRWCNGHVHTNEKGQRFIKVEVERPLYDRQTRAFVGDWVLRSHKGFKVYTNQAFEKSFDEAK
jgi:hypothetical protein